MNQRRQDEKNLRILPAKLQNGIEAKPGEATDADYLRWVRNTANDRQLISIRDERRSAIADLEECQKAHEDLRKQMTTLLRAVGYLIWNYVRHLEPIAADTPDRIENDEQSSEFALHLRVEDLQTVDGMNLDISNLAEPDGGGWRFAVRERA